MRSEQWASLPAGSCLFKVHHFPQYLGGPSGLLAWLIPLPLPGGFFPIGANLLQPLSEALLKVNFHPCLEEISQAFDHLICILAFYFASESVPTSYLSR